MVSSDLAPDQISKALREINTKAITNIISIVNRLSIIILRRKLNKKVVYVSDSDTAG